MNLATILTICIASLCLLALSSISFHEELLTEKRYCEMVDDYRASNGEHGWPDYNENYDEVCK